MDEKDSLVLSAIATLPDHEAVLEKMMATKTPVHSIYYEYRLSKAASNGVDPEDMFKMYYEAISKHGVMPSKVMSKYVILAFLRANKLQRAKDLFEWMKKEKLDIAGVHLCFAIYCIPKSLTTFIY